MIAGGTTNRQRANRQLLVSLLALWDDHEDQRFGQLVKNLSRDERGFADTWEWKHGDWLDAITDACQQWPTLEQSMSP